jgi:hypothetical protein|tara:strand:+ start:231 stop:812 length:582 start_codon:yes stop_codon:yes gene_type:complete
MEEMEILDEEMQLFIQVRDGVPFEHPVMADNMLLLFPDHDLENAPLGFSKFTRIQPPELSFYQKFDDTKGHDGCGCTYEITENGFHDVWHLIDMNSEEKEAKKMSCKPPFLNSLVFDEITCMWNTPVNYPSDGLIYRWKDSDSSWVLVVGMPPDDGESYYFNITTESWTVMPTAPSENGYQFNDQTGAWVALP